MRECAMCRRNLFQARGVACFTACAEVAASQPPLTWQPQVWCNAYISGIQLGVACSFVLADLGAAAHRQVTICNQDWTVEIAYLFAATG